MSFDAFLGAVVEEQVKAGASKKDIEAMVSDIMGIFRNPIILYPSGWMDTLPDRLRDQITMERFLQQMKAKGKPIEDATDAEALAYIYSAVLVAPMGSEWTNIYLWLGRDYGMPDPERMTPKDLTSNEEKMLSDLKRWIYRRQQAARGKTRFVAPGMKKKKAKMGCDEYPAVVEAVY